MSYKYDAFLSYRRVNRWPVFVEDIFLPMLRHWLQEELDGKAEIFYDKGRLETGGEWPQELAEALAMSKVMICLWSRQYFASDWCKAELSYMLARRKAIGGTPLLPLIIPVVIHDGESIPEQLRGISRFQIKEYASPWLAEGSRKKEELAYEIRKLAEHTGRALVRVPAYDPDWMRLAVDEFDALFAAQQGQLAVPSLGVGAP